jgi:hypothetical protein
LIWANKDFLYKFITFLEAKTMQGLKRTSKCLDSSCLGCARKFQTKVI